SLPQVSIALDAQVTYDFQKSLQPAMKLPTTGQLRAHPATSSFGHFAAATFAQYEVHGPLRVGSVALCKKHVAAFSCSMPQPVRVALPWSSQPAGLVFSHVKSALAESVQPGLFRINRQPSTQFSMVPWLGHIALASLAQSALHPSTTCGVMTPPLPAE